MTQLVAKTGHQLDWIKIQLTRLCNFSCSFCSQADWASDETINSDVLERAVFSRLHNLRLLIITGGEPLARFDALLRLVESAHARGTEVGIFSNLSLLTPEKAAVLRSAGVSWYRTTINGSTADVHERTYPRESFAKTLRGIDAAHAVGTPVKIRTTVCQANTDDLQNIVTFAHSQGAQEVDFRPYLPLGDCNPHNSFALDPEAVIHAAARILSLKQTWVDRMQLKLLPNWFDFLYRDIAEETISVCEQCNCGRRYLYIDAVGDYRSCAGHRAILGSMFEKNIEEIWDSEGQLQDTRSYKQDAYCSSCPRKRECHASNCHLVNYEAHGKFNKINPTCPSWNLAPSSALDGFEQVRGLFQTAFQGFLVGETPEQSPKERIFWMMPAQ